MCASGGSVVSGDNDAGPDNDDDEYIMVSGFFFSVLPTSLVR